MRNRCSIPDELFQEIHSLADGVLEGSLSDEQHAKLDRLICNNAQARQIYVRYLFASESLRTWARGVFSETVADELAGTMESIGEDKEITDQATEVSDSAPSGRLIFDFLGNTLPGTAGSFLSSGWPVAYLAATVIFGIGLLIGSLVHVSEPVYVARQSAPLPSHLSLLPTIVGRITGMVDCKWEEGSGFRVQGSGSGNLQSLIPNPQSLVSLGDKFGLASGLAEITYDTGAKVILQGPATYEVESAAGGYLSVGKLTARLEKKVEGGRWKAEESNPQSLIPNPSSLSTLHSPLFTVKTPTATVTDLGTEFGVEVSKEGNTTSHVFRGVVKLQVAAGDGALAGREVLLHENESARIEKLAGTDNRHSFTITRTIAKPSGFVRALRARRDCQSDAYAELVLSLEPVVYYRMEQPAKEQDQSTVFDSAPGAHHGTVMYDKAFFRPPYETGRFGHSLVLRGPMVQDYAIVPDYPKAIADRLTVSAWVEAMAQSESWNVIAANGGDDECVGQFHFALYRDFDGDLSAAVTQRNGVRVRLREGAPHPLPRGVWQHVAFVADGSTLHLYRNGMEVAAMPCAGILPQPPTASLAIGCKTNKGGAIPALVGPGYWAGRIDELAIFNRALSAHAIRQLYVGAPSPNGGKEVNGEHP